MILPFCTKLQKYQTLVSAKISHLKVAMKKLCGKYYSPSVLFVEVAGILDEPAAPTRDTRASLITAKTPTTNMLIAELASTVDGDDGSKYNDGTPSITQENIITFDGQKRINRNTHQFL